MMSNMSNNVLNLLLTETSQYVGMQMQNIISFLIKIFYLTSPKNTLKVKKKIPLVTQICTYIAKPSI